MFGFEDAVAEKVPMNYIVLLEDDTCDWITADTGAKICIGADGFVKKGPAFAKGKHIDNLGSGSGGSKRLSQAHSVRNSLPKSHTKNLTFEVSKKDGANTANGRVLGRYIASEKKFVLYNNSEEMNDEDLKGVVTHEIGHHVYFKNLSVGDRNNYAKIYREDKSYPSDYGKTHPEEDFAEAYRLYYTGKGDTLSTKRKDFFDEVVNKL